MSLSYKASFFDELKRAIRIWAETLHRLIFLKPNVVHITSNCAPRGVFRDLFTIFLAKTFLKNIFLHCHASPQDSIGSSGTSRFILNVCFRHSHRVLVLNSAAAEYVKTVSGVCAEIVPNFIDEELILSERNIHPSLKTVVFVGHLTKTKGVLDILNLALKFENLHFLLLGAMTDDIKGVEIPQNVEIIGNVTPTRVLSFLDKADVFLFPTHTEGFSMALLEAMARGLPVITTPVGANEEMLEAQGGVIVPIGDVNEMAIGLESMRDAELREKLSRFNLRKVAQNYTTSKVSERLLALYAENPDRRR